MTPVYYDNNIS